MLTIDNTPTAEFLERAILIVDDSLDNIEFIRAILENRGYSVGSVSSGLEALDFLQHKHIDLIILDVLMPEMDDFETCRWIKALPGLKEIPVVIVTALTDSESLKNAFQAGAIECIRKPVDELELITRLENILRIQHTKTVLQSQCQELQSDLDNASEIQKCFLPISKSINFNVSFDYLYSPYRTIGGDVFDVIEISEDKTLFYIGDISGHGLKSALLMTAVKALIFSLLEDHPDLSPHAVVNSLQQKMKNYLGDNYLTLGIGIIDTSKETIRFCNAGHPLPFILKSGEVTKFPNIGGMPIGWCLDVAYTDSDEAEIKFDPGDTLVLFTDGIFETCNGNNELGYMGFRKAVEQMNLNVPFQKVCSTIRKKIVGMGFSYVKDDFTVMAVRHHTPQKSAQISFRADLREVPHAAQEMRNAVTSLSDDAYLSTVLGIAFTELANNSIMHGSIQEGREDLFASVGMNDEFLELELKDFG
ncbi:MAG: fused response regulator/phosphatase [Candidatus Lindowbacteria bacterium]|nr:fused response regulator/phosphatase [Candidatus Lindowbacteria bacterium]